MARHLTTRERQILLLVAQGNTRDQIADILQISPLTVKTHAQNILAHLHAENMAHAVYVAMRRGDIW